MKARKRKRLCGGLKAIPSPGLFPREGDAPPPKRRAVVEDDPRLAYAQEEAQRWASARAASLQAALDAVASEDWSGLDRTYVRLQQAAAEGDARAQAALDVVAPRLARVLRSEGYYFAPNLGRWLMRPGHVSIFDDEEELFTQPTTAPATPVASSSARERLLDLLASYPHPALRGLRGTRRAAANRATVLAEQALGRAARASSCEVRQREALAALHYASQAHEETRWRGGPRNARSNDLERQAANLLLLPCNLAPR